MSVYDLVTTWLIFPVVRFLATIKNAMTIRFVPIGDEEIIFDDGQFYEFDSERVMAEASNDEFQVWVDATRSYETLDIPYTPEIVELKKQYELPCWLFGKHELQKTPTKTSPTEKDGHSPMNQNESSKNTSPERVRRRNESQEASPQSAVPSNSESSCRSMPTRAPYLKVLDGVESVSKRMSVLSEQYDAGVAEWEALIAERKRTCAAYEKCQGQLGDYKKANDAVTKELQAAVLELDIQLTEMRSLIGGYYEDQR